MNRPNGVFKQYNDYQKLLSPKFFADTPKAVFAAMVVSFALNFQGLTTTEEIENYLKNEWTLLYNQEIVPQKPIK